jgi:hypothetical protein
MRMATAPLPGYEVRSVYRTMSLFMRTVMWVFPAIFLSAIVWILLKTPGDLTSRLSSNAFVLLIFLAATIHGGTRVVHTIVLRDTDGTIEFHTIFRTVVFSVAEITRVRPSFIRWTHLVVKSTRGSILIPHFDGVLDVLKWIRRRNPTVPLTGM